MGLIDALLVGIVIVAFAAVFIGWFGPRGLASILFALLVIEEAGMGDAQELIFSVVTVTVVLSTVLHGMTAAPLAARYGAALEHADDAEMVEMSDMPEMPTGFAGDTDLR